MYLFLPIIIGEEKGRISTLKSRVKKIFKNISKKLLRYPESVRYYKCQEVFGSVQISVLFWTVRRQVLDRTLVLIPDASFLKKTDAEKRIIMQGKGLPWTKFKEEKP